MNKRRNLSVSAYDVKRNEYSNEQYTSKNKSLPIK